MMLPEFNPYDLNHVAAMRNDPDFRKKFRFHQKHEGTSMSFINHFKPTQTMRDDAADCPDLRLILKDFTSFDQEIHVDTGIPFIPYHWIEGEETKRMNEVIRKIADDLTGKENFAKLQFSMQANFADLGNGRVVRMERLNIGELNGKNIRSRIDAGQIKLQEQAEKQYYQEQNEKEVKQQLLKGYHAYLRQFIPEEMHEFVDFSGVYWDLDDADYDAHFNGAAFELEIPGIERMGVIVNKNKGEFNNEQRWIYVPSPPIYVVPQIDFRSDVKPYTFTGVKYPVICIAEDFESYQDLDMALARTWEVTQKYREMLDSWHKNEREVNKQLFNQIRDLVNTTMRSRSGLPHELT